MADPVTFYFDTVALGSTHSYSLVAVDNAGNRSASSPSRSVTASSLCSCDADLLTDEDHCGACGHGCLGASCVDGLCEPTDLALESSPVRDLETDATHVYYAMSGSILRVPKAGGAAEELVSSQPPIESFVIDSGSLFWVNGTSTGNSLSNAVMTAPTTGGAATDLSPSYRGTRLYRLAVDASWVYAMDMGESWSSFDGAFHRIPRAGGAAVSLAENLESPNSMGLTSTNIYWITWPGHDLFTIADDGVGGVVQLAGNSPFLPYSEQYHPQDLKAAESAVYWVNQGSASQIPGEVMKLSLQSGEPIPDELPVRLTWAGSQPWAVAIDATHVYWVTLGSIWNGYRDGMVLKVPVGGGPLTVLATDVEYPLTITVDNQYVYYGARGTSLGTLRKIPK